MNDHPNAASDPERDAGAAETAPPQHDCTAAQASATDRHEPDFSRLRMARASLDRAFPGR